MGKAPILMGLAISIIVFASLASASYYLNYPGYIDGRSYTSTSYSGYGFGPVSSRTTTYNRISTSGFVGGDYVRTTGYVRTTVDSPSYYGYGGYGGYYGPSYSRPWYQRYWDTPSYINYRGYGYMSPSLPRTYYRFGY